MKINVNDIKVENSIKEENRVRNLRTVQGE
jgi:hypothetical protein